MSEIGYNGRLLRIRRDGEVIAAVRSKGVTYDRTPIDASHEFGDGWRHLMAESDTTSVRITASGVATIENYNWLLQAWLAETFLNIDVLHPDDNTTESSDGAYLESLSYSAESSGYVAFEIVLVFSGLVETSFPTRSLLVIVAETIQSNNIAFSNDGTAWAQKNAAGGMTLSDVTYSLELGLFVAVATSVSSGADERFLTSQDGEVWTRRQDPAPGLRGWKSIIWLPEFGRFVVGRDQSGGDSGEDLTGNFATSEDGINWTRRFTPGVENFRTYNFAYNPANGILLAAGSYSANQNVMKSIDGGLTWTGAWQATAGSEPASAIALQGALGFVVIGGFGGVYRTAANGGESWARIANNDSDLSLVEDMTYWAERDILISVGNRIMTSEDGINWTIRIDFGDGRYQSVDIADTNQVAYVVRSSSVNRVYESSDGINWTPSSAQPINRNWSALAAVEVPE